MSFMNNPVRTNKHRRFQNVHGIMAKIVNWCFFFQKLSATHV